MLALGTLFLAEGRWGGEQVVSQAWVRAATSAQVSADGATDRYGYLWWVGTADGSPAYLAWGYGGQVIEVVPDRDLVVVVSTSVADHPYVSGPEFFTFMVDTVIAPALG